MPQFDLATIAKRVDGRLEGEGSRVIDGLAHVDEAGPRDLTFIGEGGYASRWPGSKAAAALVSRDIELDTADGRPVVRIDNADLAMARVLEMFAPPPVRPEPGVHPTAIVSDTATLGQGVTVGPYCVVRDGVTLGDRCVLHAQVTLMDGARLGADCVLWPGVTVRERCVMGDRCTLEPGVVIGADGFGYRADFGGDMPRIVKVPHLGHVELGDDVEVGANSCIDRAKFAATTVGSGSKLDNLVQIGHNCRIGQMVMISGSAAIGGSVTLGDGTIIGGATVLKDHVSVGIGCRIAGGSAVIDDIPDGETWGGYPAKPIKVYFREAMAVTKVPELLKRVKKLEG